MSVLLRMRNHVLEQMKINIAKAIKIFTIWLPACQISCKNSQIRLKNIRNDN